MYRATVILRAALPQTLTVWLLHETLAAPLSSVKLLLCLMVAYLGGRFSARVEKALLCELIAALALASAVVSAALSLFELFPAALLLGSAGLFLLPLGDSNLHTSDPETQIPTAKTRQLALAGVAIFCLISATCGGGWRESLEVALMLFIFPGGICQVAALLGVLSHQTHTSARIGATVSLMFVLFLALLSLTGSSL
jgi:hypothetical protein